MAVVVAAPRRVRMRKIPGVSLGVPHLNNRETTVRKVSDIFIFIIIRALAVALVVAAPQRVRMRKIPGVSLGVPHLNNRETTVQKVSDIFIFIIIREQ